jgi:hypothetical protein
VLAWGILRPSAPDAKITSRLEDVSATTAAITGTLTINIHHAYIHTYIQSTPTYIHYNIKIIKISNFRNITITNKHNE